MSDAPDIRLRNVTKRFGTTTVIDNLDLDIDRGHFYALLGPSGCGKTTTLRMIGGFELPTEGTVMLGDTEVTFEPPHKRDVNTVFQSYALFPHLTVERNVAFGLERKKIEKSEVKRRVEEVLDTVQLGHLAKRKPSQLSGGQAQRVALARALVNRPRALLLDEPLGALDLRLRRQLQIELKRIQQDVGITFIHVTHDQEEAMSMADTIAVMNGGQIEQAGSAEELYEAPQTAFVANFLGTSNLIDATVSPGGVTTHDGASLKVSEERVAGRTGDVRVGVRPEKITMGTGETNGHNALSGQVILASFLGVNVQYIVKAHGGEELTVISQNTGGPTFGPGQDVKLAWEPEHTFVVERDD
ncbi:MAG: spermidine/putrescine transport system ATP-binding protein [Solirubrobacteraceae bacterium]|nr:spermidine/putrescine transport system ATP-binding protein [Solirubrobacteraceae bacterium]